MKRSVSRNAAVSGFICTIVLCGQNTGEAAMLGGSSYLPAQLDLALGMEAMTGEISLGGRTTEWPLDIWLARIDAGWTVNPSWRINGTLKNNLNDPDGQVHDWLDEPRKSDISSLNALLLDIDAEWTFWQQGLWSLYAGAGMQHQNFQYESTSRYFLSYEQTFWLPYLLLGSDYQLTPQLRLSGNLSFAPLLNADDETTMLLNGKTAGGGSENMDGTAYLLVLSGTYYLTPWWFLKAGLHHTGIEADGKQNQTVNGQAVGQIDQEVKSSQTCGYLNVGYSF